MMKYLFGIVVLIAGVGVAACGSDAGTTDKDDGETGSSSGKSGSSSSGSSDGKDGITDCGSQSCQAGTYCLNMACAPGCTSNANCASGESCKKDDGETVGSCVSDGSGSSSSGGGGTVDCATFCEKLEQCDPQGYKTGLSQCSAAKGRECTCDDMCGGVTSACVTCYSEAVTCTDGEGCAACK